MLTLMDQSFSWLAGLADVATAAPGTAMLLAAVMALGLAGLITVAIWPLPPLPAFADEYGLRPPVDEMRQPVGDAPHMPQEMRT